MDLTDDEIVEKYPARSMHCLRNNFLPHECEWTRISCGYGVIKQREGFTKSQRKKLNFPKIEIW